MGVIRGSRESRATVPWGDAPELAGLGDNVPLRAQESRSTGAAERAKGEQVQLCKGYTEA